MELKFRAWDGYNIRYDITWFEHWHRSSNEMKWIFIKWDYYEIKTTPVMQYTWIKDKNWKEIYEGDIISFKRLKKENVPVVFIDDGFKISVKTWPCSTRTTGLNYLLSEYQCEVIWNIYENQELLK
jgi:uncharacterized phage protein (TIGR01671 family)